MLSETVTELSMLTLGKVSMQNFEMPHLLTAGGEASCKAMKRVKSDLNLRIL